MYILKYDFESSENRTVHISKIKNRRALQDLVASGQVVEKKGGYYQMII